MRYMYAVIDNVGKCYEVHRSTNHVCKKNYVPIGELNPKYLSKYYHPMPDVVVSDADFMGKWYKDIEHTIEEVAL